MVKIAVLHPMGRLAEPEKIATGAQSSSRTDWTSTEKPARP